jgi:hypothetical protein
VAGSCERGDEPSGSDATELASKLVIYTFFLYFPTFFQCFRLLIIIYNNVLVYHHIHGGCHTMKYEKCYMLYSLPI